MTTDDLRLEPELEYLGTPEMPDLSQLSRTAASILGQHPSSLKGRPPAIE